MAKSDQSKPVGQVSHVEGPVTIEGADHQQTPLKEGQPVYIQSVVHSGPGGSVEIKFVNGNQMTLGAGKMAKICDYFHPDAEKEADTLAGDPSKALPPSGAGEGAGQAGKKAEPGQDTGDAGNGLPNDPTTELPPPAAGNPGGGGGSSSIQGGVRVDRLGQQGAVDSGFDTQGVALNVATVSTDPVGPVLAAAAADTTPAFTMGTDFRVDEAAGTATFTIFRSGDLSQAATVNFATANGTATAGTDYTAASGTLSFAPYQTSASIAVVIINNSVYEGPETFSVVLSNPSVGSIIADDGAQVATIYDDGTIVDDDRSTLTMDADFSVNEAAGTATFTINRGGDTSQAITVNYTTANGTATGGSDYTAASGTVSFAAGQTSVTIGIPILNDTVFEGAETFSVSLSNPSANARIVDGTQQATIRDDGTGLNPGPNPQDDDRPVISVNDVSVNEGVTASFNLQLTHASSTDSTVTLTLTNGTATSGTDYNGTPTVTIGGSAVAVTPLGGSVFSFTMPANQTAAVVNVQTIDDLLYESSETFTLTGAITGTAGGVSFNSTAIGTGTILDNDTPTLNMATDFTVNEGAGTATFRVNRTGDLSQAATVDYTTQNGSATAGTDYTTTSNTLNFAAGESFKDIVVPILNDVVTPVFEGPETFSVVISNATGATIVDNTQVATIMDDGTGGPPGTDDDRPRFDMAPDFSANEGAGTITFTVNRTGTTTQSATVQYTTVNGTALASSDYTATSGTLTFLPNETSKTITVTVINDAIFEGPESFSVAISNPTNATIGDNSQIATLWDDGTGGPPGTDDDRPRFDMAPDFSANEAAGTITFTVNRTGTTTQSATVDYTTQNGSALAGSDYTATSGTLTFLPNETSKTITVTVINDAIYEGPESFSVVISNPTNATIGDNNQVATLLDNGTFSDDDRPTLSVNSVTVTEGTDTHAVFTVSLSNQSVENVVFTPSLASGTATVGTDTGSTLEYWNGSAWAAVAGNVTIAAGSTSVQLRTTVTNDVLYESTETFSLTANVVSGTTRNSSATGTGTILDNDGPPAFSVNDVSISEGGLMTFTVTRTGDAQSSQTVNFATSIGAGDTAEVSDFTGNSGTLTFAQGETSKTFQVQTIQDSVYEGSETFTVTLSNPTGGATIADATGIGSILDNGTGPGPFNPGPGPDDDRPTLSVSSVTVTEGTDTHAVFTVSLSNQSIENIVFTPSLASGTATVGTDTGSTLEYWNGSAWAAVAGNVTIAAGNTSVQLRTTVTNDSLYEPTEAFSLTANVVSGTTQNNSATGTGTILDNDPAPTFSVNDVSISEGGLMTFTVTRTGDAQAAQTVNFATSIGAGDSTEVDDFTSTTGTLTFAQGETSRTFQVQTIQDSVYEGSETFTVTLSNPTGGATIADATGIGTILDNGTGPAPYNPGPGPDDDRPTLSVSSVTVTEGTDTHAVFTVSLSNQSIENIVFTPSLASGTATVGTDTGSTLEYWNGSAWAAVAGNVTIAALSTSVQLRTTVTNDSLYEPTEAFSLTANVVSGTTRNSSATGTGTILDNDPAPTFSVNDVSISEGGLMTFTVTRTGDAQAAQTVNFATSIGAGDSAAVNDFTANSGTLTFAQGVATQTFTVQTIQDSVYEGSETFTVTLSNPTGGATIVDATGIGTILDDDPVPTIQRVDNSSVTEGGNLVHTVILSNASSTPTVFTYSLLGVTASAGSDYTTPPTFTNGVTLNGAGNQITVPAGVTTFQVIVSTIDDLLDEIPAAETTSLTIGSAPGATGIINDNDGPPTVLGITPDERTEGAALVHTVTLTHESTAAITFDYSLVGVSATAGSDFSIPPTFSNGVTLNGNTLTVPAGVTSFTVTVQTSDDTIDETAETTLLTIGSANANGTINDNDNVPTVSSVSPAAATEGAALVHAVNLTNASSTPITVSLSLEGISATINADFTTVLTFSNGVTLSGGAFNGGIFSGTLNVPANVSAFTVSVPTIAGDAFPEPNETTKLTVGGQNGTGTIYDDGTPLILDLNGDGVHSVGLESGIAFDVNNDGVANNTGWVSAQDGLLVRDISGDGLINDGSELFGSGTTDGQGGTTSDGFEALSLLDDNRDGVIDSNDAAWGELKVWRDLDTDGFTDNGELVSLESLGVQSLDLTYTTSDATENGNLHGLVGTYTATNGQTHEMTDVFFATGAAVASGTDETLNDSIPTLTDVVTSLDPAIGSGAQLDTHLVLVIDTSAGMGQIFNNSLETRLDRAIEATQELIDGLGIAGNVDVRIVTFNSSAQILTGADWVDGDTAKGLLDGLSASADDTRDYEIALEQVMAIGSYPATPAGSQSLLYFFSDGGPTAGSLENNATAWRTYAAAHFDQVQAFGLGGGPDTQASLSQISANAHVIGDMDQLNDSVLDNITEPQLTGLRVSDASGEVTISLNRPFTFDGLFDDPALAGAQPAFEWYRSGIIALDETGAPALADVQWSLSPDGDSLAGSRNGVNLLSLEMTDPSEGGAFLITQHVPLAGVASISVPYAFSDEDQAAPISAINLEIRDTKIASAPPTGDGGEGLYAENGADVLIYDATDTSTNGSEGWNSLFFESTLDLTHLSVPAIEDMAALRLAANTDLQHISLGDLIDIADERIDAFFTSGEGSNDVGINGNTQGTELSAVGWADEGGPTTASAECWASPLSPTYMLVEQDISLHGNTA